MKIIITGGSGFIGTNLLNYFIDKGIAVYNFDILPPREKSKIKYWVKIDLLDIKNLSILLNSIQPDFIIHLAARTDLDGMSLDDYTANTIGTRNLIDKCNEVKSIKRVIYTSSMYVCMPGYSPKNEEDYLPHTVYGESKVAFEKIVKTTTKNHSWCIIRPTSIWGPWFSEPYYNFFKIVMNGLYIDIGEKGCVKTFGFVDNVVAQIIALIETEEEIINGRVFYLGDYTAYSISEWANEIEIGRAHV